MSAAFPYLQKQLKSQLVDWAEFTDLDDYEDLNKPELAAALDKHLQANRSIFFNERRLAEYYDRLLSPRQPSPRKHAAQAEPLRASSRRRQVRETPQTEESDASPPKPHYQSPPMGQATSPPYRPSYSSPPFNPTSPPMRQISIRPPLPPSPAVVTDAIDRQTTAWRKSIGEKWVASGVYERLDRVRSLLSTTQSVLTIITLIEAFFLGKEIMRLQYVINIPPLKAFNFNFNTRARPVKVPDLFILLDGSFWKPFALWLSTNVLLPLLTSYLINIRRQHADGGGRGGGGTRRGSQSTFDTITFCIAKVTILHTVYVAQHRFWGVPSVDSMRIVAGAVPSQYVSIGAATGILLTLYDAILDR